MVQGRVVVVTLIIDLLDDSYDIWWDKLKIEGRLSTEFSDRNQCWKPRYTADPICSIFFDRVQAAH
jgi:hypothetical protein